MWTVRLVKSPVPFLYKPDYFPRTFRYKKDAEDLAAKVKANGGVAVVERKK